mmetsp:Transcript_33747/g.52097  ORF Transcript_33747/g.52097 Transcript_33747/m.52097 type:complete len:370 (+) Transcript_33747:1480-2589(+)
MEDMAKKDTEASFEEMGLAQFISALASIIVVTVNTLLIYVIRRFSIYEHHETQTKMNVSVAIKLTIARFLNSSVILVLTNKDTTTWFDGGDLVYDATILIGLMTFQQPFMYLFNIPGWIKWVKIKIEQGKGEDCTLTQREANVMCEGPPIDVANNVANFMNLVMTCVFYCPIIPQAIPLACLGCFLNYWVFKFMLLRKHKMPDMFSELMAAFFANFMPWIILTWAIAYFVFLSKIRNDYEALFQSTVKDLQGLTPEEAKEYIVTTAIENSPMIALGFVIFCLILPIRTCISKCVDEDEALQNHKEYLDLVTTFPTDYDKENPLTIKTGHMRLIEIQIKKAEEDGDEETVKMLKGQKEQVGSQNMLQQMQ